MASGFMQRFKGKIIAQSITITSPNGQQLQSVQNNITAHAGGGQANAVPLTAMACFVTAAATAGDSVVLPQAVPGMEISLVVQNVTAATINAFPNGTDTINGGGGGSSVTAAKNFITMFYCGIAGQWWTK
jgi:hypothetical protein